MEDKKVKKMMKVVSLVLVILMAVGVLAACGHPASEGTGAETSTETQQGSETAGATEGDIVLNYRTFRTDDEEIMKELIAKFESENPGIKINYSAERDETAYYQKLQADMVAGEDVDVFDAHPRADYVTMIRSGNVLDISDLEFNQNYDPGVASVSSVDGKNYGYIPAVNLLCVFYNKDLFEEMGVEVPTTYEELKTVVAKSKEAGYGGIAYPGATVVGNWMANTLLNESMQTEKMHDEYWTKIGNGELTDFNTVPEARTAFDTLAAINKDGLLYDNSAGTQLDQTLALFQQGQASMMFMGTWELLNLDTNYAGMKSGLFTMPTLEDSTYTHGEPGQIISIYSKSKNLDAAKKWVEFLASPENAQIYTDFARTTPTIEGVEMTFEGAELLDELKQKGITTQPLNDAENYDIWGNIVVNMYTELLFGSGDVDAQLAEVDRLLKEADFAG